MFSHTGAISFLALFLSLVPARPAWAQQSGAAVQGTVADPTGAVIPGATITLTPTSGKAIIATSKGDGTYSVPNVPAGAYSETITMPGFASFVKMGLRLTAGQAMTVDAKLPIQEQKQQVNVSTEGTTLSVDPDNNASSTIIQGKDLDALSDDPDELSSELTALAGPAAGPNGGQIYVDGFTGGQLPPKSSIREIRINQNPFSAQFDKLGYGRVEVFTKPGTNQFHGYFSSQGNANFLNTSNPFLGSTPQLPYHTIFFIGNFSGPLSHNASFILGGSHRDIQQNTIFDGELLAANAADAAAGTPCLPGPANTAGCSTFTLGIPVLYPQTRTDFSPRFDFQLTQKNALTARYQYETSTATNDGTGGVNLPSTGYSLTQTENTLQLDDTQTVSSRIINETRFEYQRDLSSQTPNSTAPSYNVLSNFTYGGSPTQVEHDHQDHYELQNYTSIQLAKNFIRMGGRFRSTTDSQYTDSGVNGSFSYSCLQAASCTPEANTNIVSAYDNGQAELYTVTDVVHGSTHGTLADVGLYAEDDWKPKQNLTITYGLRYESQNYTSDHADIAPRLSFSWGLGNKKGSPQTVVRGGFGLFYERSSLTDVVDTLQNNGVNLVSLQVRNPVANCTNAITCGATASSLQTYTFAPKFRAPRIAQTAIGFDEQLGKIGTVSINYQNAHGVHEFNESDQTLVAALGGQPAPQVNGTTPAYDYQFQSEGLFNQNQLSISPRINYGRAISIFGYYVVNFAKSDTGGAGTLPSVPNDLRADYGRASFDTRNRLFLGGSFTLPHLVVLAPFMVANSGAPFNIYTGTDLNDDGNLTNDRPTYAACVATSALAAKYCGGSANAAKTSIIPVNLGTGPSEFTMNLRITKTFGFGDVINRSPDQGSGGSRGGGPRGGFPRGGGGGFGGGATSRQKYNLNVGVNIANLFNDVDLATPNGSLSSTEFGKSTQLAGGFFTTNSALRRITLQTSFTF